MRDARALRRTSGASIHHARYASGSVRSSAPRSWRPGRFSAAAPAAAQTVGQRPRAHGFWAATAGAGGRAERRRGLRRRDRARRSPPKSRAVRRRPRQSPTPRRDAASGPPKRRRRAPGHTGRRRRSATLKAPAGVFIGGLRLTCSTRAATSGIFVRRAGRRRARDLQTGIHLDRRRHHQPAARSSGVTLGADLAGTTTKPAFGGGIGSSSAGRCGTSAPRSAS